MTEEVAEENVEEAILDNEGNKVELNEDGEPIKQEAESEEDNADRPEWLPEKFKSPEDLAKSYDSLEKTLKEKGKLAPDTYELDDSIGVNTEDDVYDAFSGFAKERNMSNDDFNATLKFAKESGLLDVPDYDEEMSKLGGDRDTIINSINAFSDSKLTEAEQETLTSLVYTADQARLINKIIRGNNPTNIPKDTNAVVGDTKSLQKKLDGLLNDPDIRNNREKQAEAADLATKIANFKR